MTVVRGIVTLACVIIVLYLWACLWQMENRYGLWHHIVRVCGRLRAKIVLFVDVSNIAIRESRLAKGATGWGMVPIVCIVLRSELSWVTILEANLLLCIGGKVLCDSWKERTKKGRSSCAEERSVPLAK
jgi:hypothetical protein